MPRRSTHANIAFAQILIGDPPSDAPDGQLALMVSEPAALLESIQPGTTVTRYNRTWHMAKYGFEDPAVIGRIGFDVAASPGWDPVAQDFRAVRPAHVSQFAIDLDQMRVAFQLRGSAIKAWTFQGAFQALLNAGGAYRWSVRLEGVEQPPWEEWREQVTRITEVAVTMHRPNPHYPSEKIEHLFEEAKLAAATLGAKGDSIDPDGGILRDAITHVQNGYGSLRAKAVRVEGGEAKPDDWRSDRGDKGVTQTSVPLDPETGDLNPAQLRKALDMDFEWTDDAD